jgi:hypothetical protein
MVLGVTLLATEQHLGVVGEQGQRKQHEEI